MRNPSQLQRLIRQAKTGDRRNPGPPSGRPRTAEEVRADYEARKARKRGKGIDLSRATTERLIEDAVEFYTANAEQRQAVHDELARRGVRLSPGDVLLAGAGELSPSEAEEIDTIIDEARQRARVHRRARDLGIRGYRRHRGGHFRSGESI